jgi:hypothetical protein
MKYLILILIAAISIAAVNDLKLKIYYVITYRSNERVIEKVYLKKENAQKYINTFKENHNYELEEAVLTE